RSLAVLGARAPRVRGVPPPAARAPGTCGLARRASRPPPKTRLNTARHMTDARRYDVVVIGGGIVGVATAHALCERLRGSLAVLEAEDHLAGHQSGHNSGVIHSGLYYKPGTLKAKNCVEGRDLMYRLVEEHGVPYERCGKVVVA